MSELGRATDRRHRADAERSVAAILDAALQVLGRHPQANLEEIAKAARVSRQTIYAHFESREALLLAVGRRALAEMMAALDAAEVDTAPPAVALARLLAISWQSLERYALLANLDTMPSAEQELEVLRPFPKRLERLIRRGQQSGIFERRVSRRWLVAAYFALGHAAGREIAAGRMRPADAHRAFLQSVNRVFGIKSEE